MSTPPRVFVRCLESVDHPIPGAGRLVQGERYSLDLDSARELARALKIAPDLERPGAPGCEDLDAVLEELADLNEEGLAEAQEAEEAERLEAERLEAAERERLEAAEREERERLEAAAEERRLEDERARLAAESAEEV